MSHVITQSCCSDAACVYACPVNCIQPTPDQPEFLLAEMLHIDPRSCVDCGACVSACPVDAIKPQAALSDYELPYIEINAAYHAGRGAYPIQAPVPPPLRVRRARGALRVAIVGSGPAAIYAADELLRVPGARVTIYERLGAPYGLARFGVAPDHRRTRRIAEQFDVIARHPRLTLRLGVEVGGEVTHDDLLAGHDAVIYAVGAATDRRLEIPGIDLPGVASATGFVAWYNGHPDWAHRRFDLSGERVVVVGNGNVALDVARILTVDPDQLAGTEIAPAALAALRASRVREVVVTGRRGPEHAACTLPELLGLAQAPGVELSIEGELSDAPKLALVRSVAGARTHRGRRVRMRFGLTPAAVLGEQRATGVRFEGEVIEAGIVLTSIGYRGRPVPGLPFDPVSATVPHAEGRVRDPGTGLAVPRTYVTGWIKRGPSGFLGTNRSDSQETVRSLIDDFNAGLLRDGAAPGSQAACAPHYELSLSL